MVNFDPRLTQVVFFDCEFLVPKEDRSYLGASLNVNPFKPGHRLLGGVFGRCFPLNGEPSPREYHHFWEWSEGSEAKALGRIVSFFEESWGLIKEKDARQADLVSVGFGIGRVDIPMLLSRGLLTEAADRARMFEAICKTKVVELDQVAIPFFNVRQPPILYPKFASLVAEKFEIPRRKDPSQNVWSLYEAKDFKAIEARTEGEVKLAVEVYSKIIKHVFGQLPRGS